ncbi:MAG TPA: DUF2231 domain-containing protein [Candidatus Acidoferrales bacterium]|nr:DUF2231 domain-containing protein [Candidatus Acidoferrales bacterium]
MMAANPFDVRTILQEKHAQHVVLIHFPIGLFLAGALFDALSRGRKASAWATGAYLNFSLAALSVPLVLGSGVLAWRYALEGQRLKGTLLLHLVSGLLSSVAILAAWRLHRVARRTSTDELPKSRLALEALGVLLISATGHLGGILSGVNAP